MQKIYVLQKCSNTLESKVTIQTFKQMNWCAQKCSAKIKYKRIITDKTIWSEGNSEIQSKFETDKARTNEIRSNI